MKNPIPKQNPIKYQPFIYPTTNKIVLTRKFEKRENDFLEIFLARKSIRDLSEISLLELSELLFYGAKVRYTQEDDSKTFISKRAAPSAGGRHPIDLLVSPYFQNDSRKLFYYNPIDHSLNSLKIDNSILGLFLNEINNNIPLQQSTVIWFSIQKEKTGSKYLHPESLYWRDTGALLYCLQLLSTYLGLQSCPLGSLAAKTFPNLFDTQSLLSGGGLLIGHNDFKT